MEARTLTTKRGMSITTTLSDADACDTLRSIPGTFAADLLAKSGRYGLSPDQMAWAHKLAVEFLAKRDDAPTTDAPTTEGTTYGRVMDLFRHAAQHVQYPKIRFRMADGSTLKLALCGSKSRHVGSINLTDGGSYPNNRFYGRINPDGSVARALPEDVATVLDSFNSDPAGFAKSQAEGDVCCVFCSKDLDTIESRANGYGPVCAANYGLPWNGANNKTAKPKAKKARKTKATA